MSDKRLIAVDARPLSRDMNGIRRYTEELLKLLVEYQGDVQWKLLTDKKLDDDITFLNQPNVSVESVPFHRMSKWLWPIYSVWWLFQNKPDIYWSPRHHLPALTPIKTRLFLTIHDLVWLESSNTMSKLSYLSEVLWTKRSIRKASTILTVSSATSRKIKSTLNEVKAPIFIIRNGYNPPLISSPPEKHERLLESGFFLAVGTHEPRKNYGRLVQAYKLYCDQGGEKRLLIIGHVGWGVDLQKICIEVDLLDSAIILLKNASDSNLRWCYENASAFVSASLNEGFGIPLIEAQYYGLDLIVSDIEPYREIAEASSSFYNPTDLKELTAALVNYKQSKLDMPTTTSRDFSWGPPAKKLQALFSNAL